MKNIFLFFFCICIVVSCTNNNAKLLIGKWKTTSLQNPAMDKAIAQELADIDTFGTHDAIAQQAVNLDSFKQLRKQLLELNIAEQKESVQQIQYEFSDKGVAYIYNQTAKDSAAYTVAKNTITLDGPALTGIGDIQLLYIQSISNQKLQLQMVEGTDTSIMELQKLDK